MHRSLCFLPCLCYQKAALAQKMCTHLHPESIEKVSSSTEVMELMSSNASLIHIFFSIIWKNWGEEKSEHHDQVVDKTFETIIFWECLYWIHKSGPSPHPHGQTPPLFQLLIGTTKGTYIVKGRTNTWVTSIQSYESLPYSLLKKAVKNIFKKNFKTVIGVWKKSRSKTPKPSLVSVETKH